MKSIFYILKKLNKFQLPIYQFPARILPLHSMRVSVILWEWLWREGVRYFSLNCVKHKLKWLASQNLPNPALSSSQRKFIQSLLVQGGIPGSGFNKLWD